MFPFMNTIIHRTYSISLYLFFSIIQYIEPLLYLS
uniref:Immunity protein n=1 Tax=Myoviridae sp. ctdNl2 TaxID=2825140 RepID=A0A8S5QG47_9CAUD|nr:MAG TPA: immunity protein [Myoviridae sp. ctdNl2]DAP29912.1 MAG TPA: immunity protein [Bacteriophage sp.]